jgi:hypothetical protein
MSEPFFEKVDVFLPGQGDTLNQSPVYHWKRVVLQCGRAEIGDDPFERSGERREESPPADGGHGRPYSNPLLTNHMMVCMSQDEGQTWAVSRQIEQD